MFDHLFTPWGTLSMDGLAFVQNAIIVVCALGIIGAILFASTRQK